MIEIVPKIGVTDKDNRGILIAMLRCAGELAATAVGGGQLKVQVSHLLDFFILDFCEAVNDLLRLGAIRSFEFREENLSSVRGRIQLAEHIRFNVFDQGRIFCRFDELTVDNAHNRALKSVLRRLLNQALGQQAKSAVNALLRRMEEVGNRACSVHDLTRLAFDRVTRPWLPIFKRAEWLLRGLYPDVRAGTVDGACLLFDMERLFERFAGVQVRRLWRDSGKQVVLQGPSKYFASTPSGLFFRLRPDVTVLARDGDAIRIYDSKWKQLDVEGANFGVAREDLYQLACYASCFRCPHLTLLYPTGDRTPSGLVETFHLEDGANTPVDVYRLDLSALAHGDSLPEGLGPSVNETLGSELADFFGRTMRW